MSKPENSVSPPGDSSSSQVKKQSYAAVVNKRPILKKHDFGVSLVGGVPTIEVASKFSYPWLPPHCFRCEKYGHFEDVCVTKTGSPSKVKVVEIEEDEVVEENGLNKNLLRKEMIQKDGPWSHQKRVANELPAKEEESTVMTSKDLSEQLETKLTSMQVSKLKRSRSKHRNRAL
ncbi:predicted protein [Arabidopsis lyrata subsp. lyrata]|uniref:Predicted protein n=1 Tax=Arabidopsis lyrata subsp. lyrata TaxID=81972 RepID=D7LE79_ARALL|nr:predicted protein [Arabidopsis lyrata subsp. lyrata]